VASIHIAGGTINWILSPLAFRPPKAKLKAFRKQLWSNFGHGLNAKDYADKARIAAGRAKLRKCYDVVWKTHNLHSMALYAGPATPILGKRSNTAWQGNFLRRVLQPGWISTGDFDLSVKKRRDKLMDYYTSYSCMVGQLSLPHHGSDHSFDAAVLSAFPDLTFAIAPVGPNGYGHPGLGVQAAVNSKSGAAFVRVDENEASLFCVKGLVRR